MKMMSKIFLSASLLLGTISWADEPQIVTIQNHLFQPTEIHFPSHKPVVLLIKNLDDTPEEFESGALQIEKVIPAHGQGYVHIRPSEHGHFTFVGEYHEKTARGVLIAD
jgi:hypothetical protein